MFDLVLKIIGYLPQEFLWVYIVVIVVLFVLTIGLLFKFLGGDI